MADRFRCTECGMEYEDEPETCPDCLNESFIPVTISRTESSTDDGTSDVEAGRPPDPDTDPEPGFDPDRDSDSGPDPDPDADFDLDPDFETPSSGPLAGYGMFVVAGGLLAGLALGYLVWSGALFPEFFAPDPCSDYDTGVGDETNVDRTYVECEIHEAINDYRTSNGADALDHSGVRYEQARRAVDRLVRSGWTVDQLEANTTDALWRNCEKEFTSDWAFYHSLPYGRRVLIGDEPRTIRTNDEIVRGVMDTVRAEAEFDGTALNGDFDTHAAAVNVTDSRIYAIQVFC